MPTIAWLMLGAGAWLAAVGAICALLTVAKRADAHLQPPARAIADPTDIAAAGPRPSGLAGPIGRRASATAVADPPPARPVIASASSAAALTAIAARSAHDTTPHTPNYVLHRGARAIGS